LTNSALGLMRRSEALPPSDAQSVAELLNLSSEANATKPEVSHKQNRKQPRHAIQVNVKNVAKRSSIEVQL
jgi:hypothetical protein